MQHPAQGTQHAFAAHTGRQLATVHDGHSAITGTWQSLLASVTLPAQRWQLHSTCCGPRAVPVAVPATWSLLVPWAEAPLGPCPEHCAALRAAAPMPHFLLLLQPLQAVGPTLELATWGPISRCHPASQRCQCCHLPCVPAGSGRVWAGSSCTVLFLLLLEAELSVTSLFCVYPWQCCDKRLAQEHILWLWWWLSCQHMPMTPGPAVLESCGPACSTGTKALLETWSTLSSQPGTEYSSLTSRLGRMNQKQLGAELPTRVKPHRASRIETRWGFGAVLQGRSCCRGERHEAWGRGTGAAVGAGSRQGS
ncbi:uncharacterized protein LOC120505516 [Passer montanus]|uniref:uncharacterized protein LOC120505516 n=1 Tax=Passer montanus TaxID=9160 RepID=UPI0019614611|nr:uncharacterized protein LOC120505516 [Passer montanus]